MSTRPMKSELRELAAQLRWPATPELAERVLARVDAPEPVARVSRPRLRPARALGHGFAPALAVIVALLVAGAFVPPVRSAVLDVLGIAGRERIVRVPGPPVLPMTSRSELERGELTTLARAQQRLAFAIRLPRAFGVPREVRYSDSIAGGAVTLVYPRAALLEFQGGRYDAMLQKSLGPPSARARPVTVLGAPGFFITGAREIAVLDRDGHVLQATRSIALANVLVWQRRGVAFRLQTRDGLTRALAIARSAG